MRHTSLVRLVHLVLWTAIAVGPAVLASPVSVEGIDRSVAEADTIFLGTVVGIEYRESDTLEAGDQPLPHTFVTYHVEHAIRGGVSAGDEFVVRMIGGPNRDGMILMIPGVPLIDVGDRDVVMLAGNGTRLVPFVNWTGGRFRVVRDSVYSDDGRRVVIEQDSLRVSGPSTLHEARVNSIGGHVFRVDHDGGNSAEQNRVASPPGHATARRLVALLSRLDARHPLSRRDGLSRSVDSREPFAVDLRPAPPRD